MADSATTSGTAPTSPTSLSAQANAHEQTAPKQPEATSVKDTVMSLLIAFTIALIFRGIVLEPFQIPTGSMAPTLLGAHVRMYDKETGYTWPMSPSKFIDTGMQMATPDQPVTEAREPNTNRLLPSFNTVSSSGDRIFVLKYLYPFGTPQRWDVVVFRNPTNPQEYYIKRLVGLENEELALVDGDVFTRPFQSNRNESPEECWQSKEWRIARKPLRVQDAVWQLIFDSTYTPLNTARDGRKWFSSPWIATTAGWKGQDTPVYTYEGSGATSLKWDTKNRPITDLNHYNDTPQLNYAGRQTRPVYPCSDVRVSFGYRPSSKGGSGPVGATIRVNGHEFQARIEPDGGASVSMRAAGEEGWVNLASATSKSPLSADAVTNIDLRHIDQTLQLLVNEKLVCEGRYDWTPAQRAEYSTGKPLAAVLSLMVLPPPLSVPSMYTSPEVSIDLPGACELHRVGLARDLFYQPVAHMIPPRAGGPARGTHPKSIQVQQANEFFMMGDNSPASLDGRLWADSDPWVQTLIDPADGIVPRDLIVGKAFCVFFPAMAKQWGRVPVPDLGQLRWIW